MSADNLKSMWDGWLGVPMIRSNLLANDPAAQISQGLAGLTRSGTLPGNIPRAQDTGFQNVPAPTTGQSGDWGAWNGPVPTRPPLTSGSQGATHGGSYGGGGAAGTGNWQAWYDGDVDGSYGSTWDAAGNRWNSGTAPIAAGTKIGKTGAVVSVNYDPRRDTYRHEYNGKPEESSRYRVNRWASDGMKLKGLSPQDAYNAALARLKRDMGDNWQASGFDLSNVQAAPAGQDFYVPGGGTALGNPQQPAPTQGGTLNGPMRFDGDPSTLPQFPPVTGTFNSPPPGQGAYNPNGATQQKLPGIQNTQTIAGGGQALGNYNPLANPLAVNPDGTVSHTGGGSTVSVPGYEPTGGGTPTRSNNPNARFGPASAAAIAQDPDLAYRALLMNQGKEYAPRGLFTKFRQSMFGNALSAYINALTSGGGQTLDNIDQILGSFGGAMNSGNFYGSMAETGRNALNTVDLNSLDADKVDQLIKQTMGLQTMGLSPFAQNSRQNQYKDTVQQYEDSRLQNDLNEDQNYGQYIRNTPFWNLIAGMAGGKR